MWKTCFIQCQSILRRHLSPHRIDDTRRKFDVCFHLKLRLKPSALLRMDLADLSSVSGHWTSGMAMLWISVTLIFQCHCWCMGYWMNTGREGMLTLWETVWGQSLPISENLSWGRHAQRIFRETSTVEALLLSVFIFFFFTLEYGTCLHENTSKHKFDFLCDL